MRRTGLILLTLMAILVLTAVPAFAITNGQPDGNNHPYVGLAVFDDANGPAWRCSASLLTPTVVLTAGHCTDGAVAARIWFGETTQPGYPFSGPDSYDGTPNTYPGFCIGCGKGLPGFAAGDVGIIVLSEPVPASVVSQYAALPTVGLVDTLRNKTKVDFVGYGVSVQRHGGGPPAWGGPRFRLFAPSELVSGNFVHSDEFIRFALNPGGGSGGTCFGDSGGPDLLAGTSTVLSVNSYVTNSNCSGVGYSMRVDTPAVLAWINTFLP
jgi:hypothetical protein